MSTARPSRPSRSCTSRTHDRSWVAIQHVPYEGPGLIAAEVERRGIELSVCHPYRGDPLPRLEELDGLVVMGGPMGVGDTATHPHLAGEIELLTAAVAKGRPVLGVCLGAQLLAAALGARVYRGELPEIGSGSVSLTVEGRADPVLSAAGVDELPVVHWHQDTFELPSGAVRLAGSELYPNQAFRAGAYAGSRMDADTGALADTGTDTRARAHAYGLQFHVEVDRALAEDWRTRLPEDAVIDERTCAEVEHTGRMVIAAFFDSASRAWKHGFD